MGKKKDKHRHKGHGDNEVPGHGRNSGGHGDKGAIAGIAAMAMAQVKHQLDTPAGRQVLATGLRAAADALAPKPPRAPEPPAPTPVPDAPNGYAGNPAKPPRDPSPPPRADVPPEVARVIGSVAAGLEKWVAKFGTPKA